MRHERISELTHVEIFTVITNIFRIKLSYTQNFQFEKNTELRIKLWI